MNPKTTKEIQILAEGGKFLAQVVRDIISIAKSGTKANELNIYAENEIIKFGGEPSFKGFGAKGHEYPSGICISPNNMVVHGIPSSDIEFKEGDIVGIDIGMKYKGLYTDHAVTFGIGKISDEAEKLISITKECLMLGIEKSVIGNRLGDIGNVIQEKAESCGYGVVRELTGHAVGYDVHEEPRIPNYGKPGTGEEIIEGAVLAIEPMINIGTHKIKTHKDGWGILTEDNNLSAHFEHTIAVTKNGPIILTI
jgi:methionyl aminopeptidase